jgi:bifunctional UDP-N-acetylglucosamine pyrophosphorylase/glucosamine-1-phosphate N-acetyltransferase
MTGNSNVHKLLERGVVIPCPAAVEIADDLQPERIAPGVILHAGCRLSGAETSIGPGSEIGAEAPATIHNCQLGRCVRLEGGYFSEATFLDGAHMGSGAHVRGGTLLEEEAGGAHSVAFKQTILLPFVTAGSLINFCDVLMAGGTSRKNHSEIGSSYIHFNFTPHQDKATPSLIGDVPRGVMLDQPPIFLGGQGGLVGPARIEFGVVIPAGVICREDVLKREQVVVPAAPTGSRPFMPGAYRAIRRIVINNLMFIGNLWALREWYRHARASVMQADEFLRACQQGALRRLEAALNERLRRLEELAERMPHSLEIARRDARFALPEHVLAQQAALIAGWPQIKEALAKGPDPSCGQKEREIFLAAWEGSTGSAVYMQRIAALTPEARRSGTSWLKAIVDSAVHLWEPAE